MVDDTYDGIRVFLDGMMKEIVDNEEWRNLIDRRHELPTRLQTFAIDTSASIKQETDVHRPTWSYKLTARTVPYKSANIFKFIFDGLDAMIVKAEIRKYLISTVDCRFEFFQEFHYQRSDLLKRCLDYYDDAEDSEVTGVLEKMFGLMVHSPLAIPTGTKMRGNKMLNSCLSLWENIETFGKECKKERNLIAPLFNSLSATKTMTVF